MSDILVSGGVYISTPSACVVDLTPPTFAGISYLDTETRGQLRVAWAAGTDVSNPIRYEVYVQASVSMGLFNVANIAGMTDKLQLDIFTLADGSFLENGETYHVGVRAVDAVGNRDANTVSMNRISTGILTSIDTYHTHVSWSINETNMFGITIWGDKNDSAAIPPYAALGTASYQVYDRDGNAVVGLSGTGVSANAEGLFVFPAVPNLTQSRFEHYEIKTSINIDGEDRVNYTSTHPDPVIYQINGIADINTVNGDILGSFWATEDFTIMTTGLSNGSFEVYDASGNLIPGLSESGLVANGNGIFVMTPISLPSPLDPSVAYIVKLQATIRGKTYSTKIILGDDPTGYQVKSCFSINALNQFQGTLWANKLDELANVAILGNASYQVYDKDGNTVVGLNESGLTPDGNGLYEITPVSAVLLADLTHYVVKVTIEVSGHPRVIFKGFTLLGT